MASKSGSNGTSPPFDVSQFKAGFEPEEIRLDDVVVTGYGGTERRPWQGESVWIEPFIDPEDEIALARAWTTFVSPSAGENIEAVFETLCDTLSRLVYAWTLTDKHGDPLPAPHRNPDAFRAMNSRLMAMLIQRVMGIGTQGGGSDRGEVSTASGRGSAKTKARRSR